MVRLGSFGAVSRRSAVKSSKTESVIDTAASRLRELCQAVGAGSLLGSEEELLAKLSVSRNTLRQVARLLEREGWLTVRRGLNGGYFAAIPDLQTIVRSASAYLERVEAEAKEITIIAALLWVELFRRAACIRCDSVRAVTQPLRDKVLALPRAASFADVMRLELNIQSAICDLINSRYIELLFQVNGVFAERVFPKRPGDFDDTALHATFVHEWRQTTLMELAAIDDGDEELAVLAARHCSNLWARRMWEEGNPQ